MHDLAFADSVRPKPQRILKLLMLPYSLGHEILLLEQRNPLLLEGFESLDEVKQRAAVIRAVLICSQSWAENKKPHRWLRLWGWTIRNADSDVAIADFRNYRLAGITLPPTPGEEADEMANGKKEEGRELGGPFLARLYNFLCALPQCGEAMDFPFGMAAFLYFAHLECEGQLKIENRKEAQIKQEMAGHRADWQKEQEAKCQA